MASELENALKNVATQIGDYVKDVATLSVETKYVLVGSKDDSLPIAKTVIKLDGDSETTVPLRQGSAGQLELDTALFDVHQRNVSAAIEYRARMMAALLDTLRTARL